MAFSWRQVHLIAARETERVFREHGIDRTRRVDPFSALEAEGVVVFRRPLKRVAGLYLPGSVVDGGKAGVLVNVSHPLSKQRFTAAHFSVTAPGRRVVHLEMRQPWLKQEAPADEYRVEIDAAPKPTSGMVRPLQLVSTMA